MLSWRRYFGLIRPGVSIKISWYVSVVKKPNSRFRVVCGFAVTMDSFVPKMAFMNVLLPAFGSPIIAAYPIRNSFSFLIVNLSIERCKILVQDMPKKRSEQAGFCGFHR